MKTINRTQTLKTSAGFTLIELLVVIAIISILAAILFPVFATAREKARQTTCTSNEKQICLAMLQYAQDFDEQLCSDRPTYYSTTNYTTWDEVIAPYVRMGNQYSFAGNWSWMGGNNAPWAACPDDTARHAQGSPATILQPRSYAMIAAYQGVGSDGQQLSKILSPSGTLLIAETVCGGNNVGDYHATTVNCPSTQWNNNNAGVIQYAAGNHTGGWNYAFCDGHVKWLDPRATIGAGGNLVNSGGTGPRGMWTIDDTD